MMRTVTVATAESGDVLYGCYPGHDKPLPELDEQIVVEALSCWHRWRSHGRVIGLNHGLRTYVVRVGEMILEEIES